MKFSKPLRLWTALLVVLCLTSLEISPAAAGLSPSARSGGLAR